MVLLISRTPAIPHLRFEAFRPHKPSCTYSTTNCVDINRSGGAASSSRDGALIFISFLSRQEPQKQSEINGRRTAPDNTDCKN